MTAKHRKLLALLTIALLAVLNIWRWQPTAVLTGRAEGNVEVFKIEDFEVEAVVSDAVPSLSRDIFYPKVVTNMPESKAGSKTVPGPQAKTSEELARDSAQAEFSQIRCVGVSVRKDRIQAYISNSGEHLLVSIGDKVGSRFVVENIVPDGVSLRDPDTGFGGLIAISGK